MKTNHLGRRETYRADGFSMRFWECGAGEQLLFLHGAGLPASSFRENIRFLSRRYRVIIPEIPGFGGSDFPRADWDFDAYATLISGFLRSRGYRISVMVGYSFGGGIALSLAPRVETLRRLVLFSPAGKAVSFRSPGLVLRIFGEALSGLRDSVRMARLPIFARIVRDFCANVLRWSFLQGRMITIAARCLRRERPFESIAVPTTIVSVDGDRFFPPRHGEGLRQEIPSATWTLRRGTHLWVLIDHPGVERYITGD